jgi:hypothetical protein
VIIAAAGMAAHLAGTSPRTPCCPSSASPLRAARWTAWTPCWPPCRCPAAFLWPPLALNGAKRRRAGRSDAGHPRRAHRRAAGGGPGENGPLHR